LSVFQRFLLARAAQALVVIAIVVSLAFALVHVAPGDPFRTGLDDPAMAEAMRDRLRAQFGYDRPLPEQYLRWVANVVRGNFGWSHSMERPVLDVLRDRIPSTALLMATGLGLGLAAGIALGAWQGARQGSRADRVTSGAAMAILSAPEFLLALGAVAFFGSTLRLFPVGGLADPAMHDAMSAGGRILDVLRHLTLPALTLAVAVAVVVSRYQRSSMIAVLPEDFIRTARAKGADERTVIVAHALRNALGPVITISGLLLPALVSGAVFVETIFAWPGMGHAMVDAVIGRDYPLVIGSVLVTSALVTVGSALADVISALADPRIGLSR
jgi:peptide/nickel transport system permease protein